MKLVTYEKNSKISCGLLTDEGIIDIPSSEKIDNPPRSVLQILNEGKQCLDKIRALENSDSPLLPIDSVRLLAPILHPPKILALAGNYSKHIQEASLKKGFKLGLSDSTRTNTVPRPFIMPSTVITGTGSEIPWPAYSEQIDYEIELAVVIGKTIKDADAKIAADAVAGYTIANDVSARSITFKEGRNKRPWDEFYDWLNGKWADGFLPTGPWLVTTDEIENPQNLDMELKVNGKTRQKANTSQMIYNVADIISFISHLMTLTPGDIIATGTPAGVAVATGEFLESGDIIECSIEKLGTLTNTLGDKPEKLYKPLKQ